MIARILFGAAALAACGGGGGKKVTKKPTGDGGDTVKEVTPPAKETEADREAKRLAVMHAFAPEDSTCLPTSLRDGSDAQLGLAQVGPDAVVCATDVDASRLAGVLACWKIDLGSGALAYTTPVTLPGHEIDVKLDDNCARGLCLPADAKAPGDNIAHMAWNNDNTKAAVLAGDDVHLFDVAGKTHESSFSVKGDKGVTSVPMAVHWVGEDIFVVGDDGGVWAFKPDGTQVGPLEDMGKTPRALNAKDGAFIALDTERVGVAERGYTTLVTYSSKDGARAKITRKLDKPACKPAEIEAYWTGSTEGLAAKCTDWLGKTFSHLKGADALAGSTNFLVLYRGPRTGELAVLEAKTLKEKRTIKLPFCGEGGDAPAEGGAEGGSQPLK